MAKKLTMFMLAAALLFGSAVVFNSCSKDDDGLGSSEMIVGEWAVVASEGYEKITGEEDYEWNEIYEAPYAISHFEANGTVTEEYLGESIDVGTWRYSGGKLYFTWDEDGEIISTVKELTNTKMVTVYYEKLEGGGVTGEVYDKTTYKKVVPAQ